MKKTDIYIKLAVGFALIFFNIVLNKMEILSNYQCILFGIAILLLISLRLSIQNRSHHRNLSELFNELNVSKLKTHIALKVNECPNNFLIKDVCLYRGDDDLFKYNIVVRTKKSNGFKAVKNFWDRDAQDIFHKNFIEVYIKEPLITFPYQPGNFWHDWRFYIVSKTNEIGEDLIDKKSKLLLYNKSI